MRVWQTCRTASSRSMPRPAAAKRSGFRAIGAREAGEDTAQKHVSQKLLLQTQESASGFLMQIEMLQSLALSVAQARSPDTVLREMVEGLGLNEGVALARVWLIEADAEGRPWLSLKA